MTKLGLSISE